MYLTTLGQKKELGISGFGISVTTMEEVFIKVGDSGVDEATLASGSSHAKVGIVESSSVVDDNIAKTISKALCTVYVIM